MESVFVQPRDPLLPPPSRGDAAYAFALFGSCPAKAQAAMLTAVSLLLRTRPSYDVCVLLADACAAHTPLHERVRALGAQPMPLEPLRGVSCQGNKYRPALTIASRLNESESQGSGYFDATYTKLRIWDLVQYKAVRRRRA